MSPLSRVAFIGNSLPRRCGIATFTTDLQQAVARSREGIATSIVAMTDHGQAYDYPSVVGAQINDERIEDYASAAEFLNAGQFEVASLQHEFGIFGGDAGSHILALPLSVGMIVIASPKSHAAIARIPGIKDVTPSPVSPAPHQ